MAQPEISSEQVWNKRKCRTLAVRVMVYMLSKQISSMRSSFCTSIPHRGGSALHGVNSYQEKKKETLGYC